MKNMMLSPIYYLRKNRIALCTYAPDPPEPDSGGTTSSPDDSTTTDDSERTDSDSVPKKSSGKDWGE